MTSWHILVLHFSFVSAIKKLVCDRNDKIGVKTLPKSQYLKKSYTFATQRKARWQRI